MPTDLRITLLGTFRIELNGRPLPVDALHRSKAKALVKLLALSTAHRRHREQLIDILWFEADPHAAAASLRKALHQFRRDHSMPARVRTIRVGALLRYAPVGTTCTLSPLP